MDDWGWFRFDVGRWENRSLIMGNRIALITGITGQDGSYLAELLLSKGYQVHGIVRRVAIEDPEHRLGRILHLRERVTLHAASLESYASIRQVVEATRPDECYHLAAQSFVAYSFDDEFSTLNSNINGTHYVLSAIRSCVPGCRFYFAGSSEMFGRAEETPQSESTRFHPRSSYGISKVAGFDLTRNYREAYGMHASSGILFNHESPRRGYEFVTRKNHVRSGANCRGEEPPTATWEPGCTARLGPCPRVRPRNVVDAPAGQSRRLRYRNGRESLGGGVRGVGVWTRGTLVSDFVEIDPNLFRPAEVSELRGDASKAQRALGWRHEFTFRELVHEMLAADFRAEGLDPSSLQSVTAAHQQIAGE